MAHPVRSAQGRAERRLAVGAGPNEVQRPAASDGGQSRVTFTHEGLASADECFDVCHDAWRHYITESLRQRIESGHGTMRTREEDQAAVRQHAESQR